MANVKKHDISPDELASRIGEQVGESLGRLFGAALGAELGKKLAEEILRDIKADGGVSTEDGAGEAGRCPPRGGIIGAAKDSSDEPKILRVKSSPKKK